MTIAMCLNRQGKKEEAEDRIGFCRFLVRDGTRLLLNLAVSDTTCVTVSQLCANQVILDGYGSLPAQGRGLQTRAID